MTLSPDFWSDQVRAKKVQKEFGQLQEIIQAWEKNFRELEEADMLLDMAVDERDMETQHEVAAGIRELRRRIDEVELECMFSGEHDANNAILTIHAGAGGTEAQDWVSMLMRMYLRWAEEKEFSTSILDYLPGDEAGVKSVTIMVKGRHAYGLLRSEVGIHRLVRISPFDASGRRHTSFASVMVMPELDDTIDIDINEKDLRIDTYPLQRRRRTACQQDRFGYPDYPSADGHCRAVPERALTAPEQGYGHEDADGPVVRTGTGGEGQGAEEPARR
jgi:peptide chain release factor 2